MSKHEDAVKAKIDARCAAGFDKYKKTMERTDLTRLQWLQHAQDEAMDCAIYLQRLMDDEEREGMGGEVVGSLNVRRFRGADSMVNHDFEYLGNLPDGTYELVVRGTGSERQYFHMPNSGFKVPMRRRDDGAWEIDATEVREPGEGAS